MIRKILIFATMLFTGLCFSQHSDSTSNVSPVPNSGVLSVYSSVPAGVWLNGLAFGNTPLSMEIPTGWTVYSVRAPGYWTDVSLINIEAGAKISQEIQLKKYYGQSLINLPEMSSISELKTLEYIYDSLSVRQKELSTPDSLCLAYFVQDYPLLINPPVPLHEKSAEYRKYYDFYSEERQLSFNEFYATCSGSAQQSLNTILSRIKELGGKQISGYVPVIRGEFEPTVSSGLKGILTFYFRSPDGRAEVAWRGSWENDFLPGDELVRAVVSNTPAALAFLTTQNQTVWIPVEHGYSRHFYKYSELNIAWNGLLFTMNGEFLLPDYIRTQPEVAAWLETPDTLAVKQDTVKQDSVKIPEKAIFAKIPAGHLNYKGKDVQIRPFTINTMEIDQGTYKEKCGKKDFGKFKGDSLPAHSITWNEANSCCAKLGGELPTEAEWEYAARAGNPAKYVWPSNSSAKDYAEFNGKKPIVPAGKTPNGWGLYDMFGNLTEWVKDDGFWFGKYKFLKGGSWKSRESDLSVERSEEEDARYWGTHVGFRCVYK